jgi:hypothetical protein
MDTKITLSFDESTINAAKRFADAQGISLSRLTEFLYKKITAKPYSNLEDFPVADWVNMLAEGETEYKTSPKNRADMKQEYFKSKK